MGFTTEQNVLGRWESSGGGGGSDYLLNRTKGCSDTEEIVGVYTFMFFFFPLLMMK